MPTLFFILYLSLTILGFINSSKYEEKKTAPLWFLFGMVCCMIMLSSAIEMITY